MGRRIQSPPAKSGKNIRGDQAPPKQDEDYPLFSMRHLISGEYCFSKLDKDHKASVASSIFKRKDLTWKQLQTLHRHKLGFEMIPINQLRGSIPNHIKDGHEKLMVFRFKGMAAMVGYRERATFYILYFDHNFTLYDHS